MIYIFMIHDIKLSTDEMELSGVIFYIILICFINIFTVIIQESRGTTHRTFKKVCGYG